MIKVVVDSTADVPSDTREMYDITVVPLRIQFGRESFRDDIDMSRDEFYQRLVSSDTLPGTAAPSIGDFEQVFRQYVDDGHEVISLSLSGALSATFTAAQQAAQQVDPERVACIDTRSAAMPITYMAVAAVEAARAGHSLKEVVTLIESLRPRMMIYVALETLRYLEKGGRIGRMRAFLGTMLSVKPILKLDNGEIFPVEQVRTWKRVPKRMVDLMASHGTFEQLSILYTTGVENAERLADMCAASGLIARERIRPVQVGAVIGTHVGPGSLGIMGMIKQI
ncbi:MAG: DegV family protein [Chloroflexota bacterium]